MTERSVEGRTGYILVVGERTVERQATARALQGAGLEIYAATDAEVVGIPDLLSPSLLVLDDSPELADRPATQARLMKHPPLVGVPLLLLTHDRGIETYSGAITQGAAACLQKPYDEAELVVVAQRLSHWRDTHGCTEKRRRMRRPLIMKVEIDIRSQKVKVPGQMLDVSSKGCRVELDQAVLAGEKVRVILHGPQGSTHVALGAVVAWAALEGDRHQLGLRFSGSTAVLAPTLLGAPAPPGTLPGVSGETLS